jgi:hypothetical protein
MPDNNPLIGEVWRGQDFDGTNIFGVISELLQTMVLLVCTNGARFHIDRGDFIRNWRYEYTPPTSVESCSQSGCAARAVFRYARNGGFVYACPVHIPFGVTLGWAHEDEPPRPLLFTPDSLAAIRELRSSNERIQLDNGNTYGASEPEFVGRMTPAPDPWDSSKDLKDLVRPGSRWIQPENGRLVQAISLRDGIVTFQQDSWVNRLTIDDFVSSHRPYAKDLAQEPEVTPLTPVFPNEEYESLEGVIRVVSIDSKRERVEVTWADGHRRNAINLREFTTGRWRKIERRSFYERLLEDD